MKTWKDFLRPYYFVLRPIILNPLLAIIKGVPQYIAFLKDLSAYRSLAPGSNITFQDIYPILANKSSNTSIDPHYFFQNIWAFKLIQNAGTREHVDVGSKVEFAGILSTITDVTFIDIRPVKVNLRNFYSLSGSILSLPYPNKSLKSISCLHVIEHIGLGRYGDSIDPEGSTKAANELIRVLAPTGNLFLSTPIGKSRICFNAHRIFSPDELISMFTGLKLKEFSVITDEGDYVRNTNHSDYGNAKYACGLFWFQNV